MSRNNQFILFAAACPVNMEMLKVKEEYINIFNQKERFDDSSLYRLKSFFEMSIGDLSNHVLDVNPYIIHLSNHSLFNGNTVFEEKGNRQSKEIPADAFGNFFSFSRENLELVFLNSCYSIEQAEKVSKHVKYVVAMSDHIPDDFAISFAANFYKMLFIKKEYLVSFAFAHNHVCMSDPAKVLGPQFYENGNKLKVEEIKDRLAMTKDSIKSLTSEVETFLENEKSIDERRAKLRENSPHQDGLRIMWNKRKQMSESVAAKVFSEKSETKQLYLAIEISDILIHIHDAIAMDEISHLACYLLDPKITVSDITYSLYEVSNRLQCDKRIPESDRRVLADSIAIILRHF